MPCVKELLRSFRQRKYRSCLLLTGVMLIYYLIRTTHFSIYLLFTSQNITNLDPQDEKIVSLREYKNAEKLQKIVHLDFKGAPPKVDYVLRLIPFLKNVGATGILIEYEDSFPYKDGLEEIQALNAYTWSDVSAIARTAEKHNLTVIPLIPTFSHLEFVLKLEKYKSFREVENNPETLCPNANGVYKILFKMIDQILEVHRESKYLHIGCDRVRYIGKCPRCKNVMKKTNVNNDDIYVGHIKKIAEYINTTYKGVRTMVWGNRIAKQKLSSLVDNRIPELVDIMLSNFQIEYSFFPWQDMPFYGENFPKLWVAGSFKGTTENTRIVTDVEHHMLNLKLWADFMEHWKQKIDFQGIVLVGWQRHSHFDVLCELLPVSLPSLVVNLRSLADFNDFDYDGIKQSLICNDFVPLNDQEITNMDHLDNLRCDFPGFEVYRSVHYFFNELTSIKSLLLSQSLEGMTFYNVLRSEWNPSQISKIIMQKYNECALRLAELENRINATLLKYYDGLTVNEWITTHVFPARMYLQAALQATDLLVKKQTWPRHPLRNDLLHLKSIFNNFCHENNTIGCTFLMLRKLS